MKQTHDSSDDYKFPVTANEALSKKTDESLWTQMKLLSLLLDFVNFVGLCNDKNTIIFYAYGCLFTP